MNRLLLPLLSTALLLAGFGSAADAPRPNLLFILADDLGYGDLGCYGAPDADTPHLDRLAAEGVRFTDFYANAPVCSPTRVAFLTGRYQQRCGMDNALYYQEMGRGLPADGVTIADRLKAAGYATGLSGKWHVGYERVRRPPQKGFDHFFGLLGGNHHYFEHMDRIGVPDLWLGNEAIEREGYTTDLITGDAIDFLERHCDEPFFLFVSHLAPHFPYQGPGDADRTVKPKTRSWQQGDRATAVAMIERMDEGIGELLDRLEELGLEERTLVVFTSDNGGHSHARNAPLRGKKTTLWEGGIRVPCIARWSGVIPPGSVTDQVGITMDWTATFAALAGDEATSDRDEGIDLMPVLRGDGESVGRTLFWRQRPGPVRKKVPSVRAVRHGKWKLHQPVGEDADLFDLENDIAEENDLANRHPEIVEDLLSRHEAWEERVYGEGQ